MTAPRKPVAWVTPKQLNELDAGYRVTVRPRDEDGRGVPLYTAPDLQPLWALVDELRSESLAFEKRADASDQTPGNAEFLQGMAEMAERAADRIKIRLEAMQ